jgi:hypothetical protein
MFALAACGGKAKPTNDMGGGNPDMAPSCVMNPMTSVEIENACTDADSYDKQPFYPTRAPGGTLPPLQ